MNKTITSWCFFDFANSSYSAVIAATIFPVYYANIIVGNTAGMGDVWWGRAISVSMAIVAITSPFLGGIADYAKIRKKLLLFLTLLCIAAVASFSFLSKDMAIAGFVLIVLANVGMEGGLVFYNSFLPEIVQPTHQGRVSAWGFGIGYAGSIFSLLLALFLVRYGMIDIVWLMVALFFAVFSLPAFIFLPKDPKGGTKIFVSAIDGFRHTCGQLKKMWLNKNQRRFLIAYLIYEDGVNTVIVFSSIFAATTLGFKSEELIYMYLIVQATALAGVFLMARYIDYWGPKRVILLSLTLWIAISIAIFFVHAKLLFAIIASIAGFGLGTVQAATRAFYTQFIVPGKESEFFGVYSFVGKSSAIMGPLVFGYLSSTFGSQRPAVLSIALFFLLGFIIIKTVSGGQPNVS
ncbi:MAG: MFS transporter [Proteobacteria bacterium]|nr:MFS transporter [Pseudomonadota bacterium]